jgi:chitodextrinase
MESARLAWRSGKGLILGSLILALAACGAGGPEPATVASGIGGGTPDTQAPTAPTLLTATAAGSAQINLAWTAATDNVAVTQYRVERCQGAGCGGASFAQIGVTVATNFVDTGLTAGTSYNYRVRAADAVPNLGPYSNVAGATTSATLDVQAPTAPTLLNATAISVSQINLAWTAATDDVAVTQYRVERCQGAGCGGASFAQIGTTLGSVVTFNDTGLAASTSYSYRVRAADAVPNVGPYSNVASTTTPGLASATYTISWNAVNDVNVTGYRIYYTNTSPIGAGPVGSVNVGGATTSVVFDPGANGMVAGQTLYVAISSTGAGGIESPMSSPVSVVVQ